MYSKVALARCASLRLSKNVRAAASICAAAWGRCCIVAIGETSWAGVDMDSASEFMSGPFPRQPGLDSGPIRLPLSYGGTDLRRHGTEARRLGILPVAKLFFQPSDSCLCCGGAGLGFGSSGLGFGSSGLGFALSRHYLWEVGQVALPHRVIPAQFFVLPAQVQVQDIAVPPVMPFSRPVDGDGLIHAVYQAVAGDVSLVVTAAGGVKPPVFGNPHPGVVPPLDRLIAAASAFEATSSTKSGGLPCSGMR